ncbi:hypothetical protein [Bacillus wiedmannii]|uniref:hypothetical protein n=1 Tax=Bacillus wiedmannii TaxID=1890302 RepID=UPI000BFE7CC6|nr:hypothetical protein [Bacillus wiedmannii]PHG45977.1 hypothetical protein COI54_16680 [Bacillus wiedmannii]
MFNCRGPENRVRLLEKYNVKPISHTKLLKGQVKRSCAKEMLTDEYYIFTYHAKNNINESGTFVCGTHVARHFLELLHLEPLPLFNPLKGNNENVDLNDNLNGNSGGGNIVWDPLAKELYNAINLLIVCWDKALYGTLLRIKEELIRTISN